MNFHKVNGVMLIFILVLLSQWTTLTKAQFYYDCPTDWIPYSGRCYHFVFYPKATYQSAKELCQENGATILGVESYAEHDFVSNWLITHDSQRNDWYTSGVVSVDNSSQFYWEGSGEDIQGEEFWNADADRVKHGSNIIYSFSNTGKFGWTRRTDTEKLNYICEISQSEVYRIKQETRDFTYGTKYNDPNLVPRGPKFFLEQSDIDILGATTSVFLECAATGIPQPKYTWTKLQNGTNQIINVATDKRYTLTNGRFTIQNPSEQKDEGTYQCSVQNRFGSILSAPLFLSFADLGSFSNTDIASVQPDEYKGAVIECPNLPTKSQAAIRYQWKRDREFIFTELNAYVFISGDGNLYFSEVTRADDAEYYCLATLTNPRSSNNYVGSAQTPSRISRGITLQVLGAPSSIYNVQIQDSFVQVFPRQPVAGNDIRLECFAYGSGTLEYRWVIPVYQDDRFISSDSNRFLTIKDVRLSDSGIYQCHCKSRMSGTSDQKNFTLIIEAKPYFTLPLKDEHVDADNQMTWRCEAQGIPAPQYTWYKNGQPLKNSASYTVFKNLLIINNLTKTNEGMYQCEANNTHGVTMSTAQLRVLSFAPSFLRNPLPTSIMGTIGGTVTIICKPEAAPYPDYTWSFNGVKMSLSESDINDRKRILANGNFVIKDLTFADVGYYTCNVQNKHGSAQSSTYLNIVKNTRLVVFPAKTDVVVNSTAFIQCEASYSQSLDIVYTWLLNEQVIDFKKNLNFVPERINKGGLYIQRADFDCAGRYTCIARTQIDSANASTVLRVIGPPGPPAGVYIDRRYPISINRAVKIKWTDGALHGSPIISYYILIKSNFSSSWTTKINIRALDTIIPGEKEKKVAIIMHLDPGTSFKFKVMPVNKYGVGTPSLPTDEVAIPGSAPEKAPAKVGGGKGKVGTLTVTWEPLPPRDQNGWGIGYLVEWRLYRKTSISQSDWSQVRVQGNAGKFVTTVGEENYYREYETRVTAYNIYGTSNSSMMALVHSADAMPIGVPTNIRASRYNSTALIVSWNPVPDTRIQMKGKLRGYKINYWKRYGEVETQAVQAVFPGQRQSGIIIGLLPNTWYYVNVLVYNEAGNGQKSEKFPQKTDMLAPQLFPTEVMVHSHTSNSVRVTFRGVSTQAGEEPLQGYKIKVWEASENIRQAHILDVGKMNEGTISGIERGYVYKLRVLGYSRGGDGAMSSPVTMFTLGGYVSYDRASTSILPAGAATLYNGVTCFTMAITAAVSIFFQFWFL